MKAHVALSRCSTYTQELVDQSVEDLFKQITLPEIKGKKVLLKPNMLSPSAPEKAVTTHPAVLRAVIREIKKREAKKIIVGDSPGFGTSAGTGARCGLKQIGEEEGVEWASFNGKIRVQNPDGIKQKQFELVPEVLDADLIVSLPKLKTHGMMYYTGAMKNLFGLIPGLEKSRFHFRYPEKNDFAAMIVDLNRTVRPHLAIMDGIIAMEGQGPGNGTPKEVGLLGISTDLLALDCIFAEIIGYDPLEIPILKIALETGFWVNRVEDIELTGMTMAEAHVSHFKKIKILHDTGFFSNHTPKLFYNMITDFHVPRPFFSEQRCIQCGRCVKICPADALKLGKPADSERKIIIDYDKCIRCYCCDEVCPEKAIRISRIRNPFF